MVKVFRTKLKCWETFHLTSRPKTTYQIKICQQSTNTKTVPRNEQCLILCQKLIESERVDLLRVALKTCMQTIPVKIVPRSSFSKILRDSWASQAMAKISKIKEMPLTTSKPSWSHLNTKAMGPVQQLLATARILNTASLAVSQPVAHPVRLPNKWPLHRARTKFYLEHRTILTLWEERVDQLRLKLIIKSLPVFIGKVMPSIVASPILRLIK